MFRGCRAEDMPPHIYAAAQIAYRQMLSTRQDQSIVLLGRSGSGKTANARHLLHYLTATAGTINSLLTGRSSHEECTCQNSFSDPELES